MYLKNKGDIMEYKVSVSDSIYWIGVNDRETPRFENYWPLTHGIAYNSYLINDEKVAILDTVKFNKTEEYLEKIKDVIGDKKVDYLVIHHMEPDHSSSISSVIAQYPDCKIVGNKKTFGFLEGFYNLTDNLIEVGEGDELDLGKHKLKFYMTPMLHWPESMMSHEQTDGILFTMDAFGAFGALSGCVFDDELYIEKNEDEMRRYYTNVVGKYSPIIQRTLKKLSALDVKIIAPAHGPIWRSNPARVWSLYDKWSRYEAEEGVVIAYGSMYGNTAKMADFLARTLAKEGIKNVCVYDSAKTHISHILSSMWKYKGVFLGSSAYNTLAFPPMENLMNGVEHANLKNRYVGVFGNMSWSGGGVKAIDAFVEKIKWEKVYDSIEAQYSPKEEQFNQLTQMAKAMASKLRENSK